MSEAESPPAPPVKKAPLSERAERLYLRFFAAPTDGTAAAFFRVTFGLLAIWVSIGIIWNLRRFYGHDGMLPYDVVGKDRFIWLFPISWAPESRGMLQAHAVAIAVSSTCVLLGFRPRLFTLLLAYVHCSLQVRNPMILNSGDRLFSIVAFLGAFAPLSRRFSVDAWLAQRFGKGKSPAPADDLPSVWGQRLLGLQISYVYLNSVIAKLGNVRWRNGMALRDVLASPVFAEFPRFIDFTPLIWFLTFSTLLFELSFPVLVWFKRYRPLMLLWGIAFHAGIDAMMIIPIFSAVMIATYPAFLTDDECKWLFARVRKPSLLIPRFLGGSASVP